jgi:hypothetical protein
VAGAILIGAASIRARGPREVLNELYRRCLSLTEPTILTSEPPTISEIIEFSRQVNLIAEFLKVRSSNLKAFPAQFRLIFVWFFLSGTQISRSQSPNSERTLVRRVSCATLVYSIQMAARPGHGTRTDSRHAREERRDALDRFGKSSLSAVVMLRS